MGAPKKPKIGEAELRAMIARKARDLCKVIISKPCRTMLLQQAQHFGFTYQQAEGLAALKKKRDPRYFELRDTKIMRDLEPEAYAADPYGTTQRYSAAIRLRKKQATRA